MQATKLPPGQSPGVGEGAGGVGVGAGGVGLGVGEASVVEPIGPNLMSEKITWDLACADSTSSGLPESAEQYPRRAPGSVDPTGKVASNHNILAKWSSQSDITSTTPASMAF